MQSIHHEFRQSAQRHSTVKSRQPDPGERRVNPVFRRPRTTRTIKRLTRFLAGLLILASLGTTVRPASVTLAWNPSPDPTVKGYNIYYWNSSVATSNILFAAGMFSVGAVTNATVTNLVAGTTYTFAATTVDASGVESLLSSEVIYKIPTNAVVIAPGNCPPTLNALGGLTINSNVAPQTVNLTGITSGASNEVQTLTVTATSSNTNLIGNPTINYTSPNTNGTLSFTPVFSRCGTATITVTVNDGGASNNLASRSFLVTVGLAPPSPTVQVRSTQARQFMLTVTGQVGHTYDIQATQDFKTWTVIGTLTVGASGSLDFADTNTASFSRRFYRTRG